MHEHEMVMIYLAVGCILAVWVRVVLEVYILIRCSTPVLAMKLQR